MFWLLLTQQFSTQTGKETSTRQDYSLRTRLACQHGVCMCVLLRWCFGGWRPLIFNLSLAPQAPRSCTISSVLWHDTKMQTCTHSHTPYLFCSAPCLLVSVHGVLTHGRKPTVSVIFGDTVSEFLCHYLKTADVHSQHVMGKLHTGSTASHMHFNFRKS